MAASKKTFGRASKDAGSGKTKKRTLGKSISDAFSKAFGKGKPKPAAKRPSKR